MNLVIVESPAKAKTIEGYLGGDFVVKSSFGHIRDLVKSDLSIDVEKNFEPTYINLPDKKSVIAELKKLSKDAELVWLATDEDREGEAISWHLSEALGLKEDKTRRIVFNEITKTAILKAIEKPRSIDQNLVNAQQARRVLDRLVGFELSPVLWRKVKPSLSAGRVQSVSVRILVDREREIQQFTAKEFYRVIGNFITPQNKDFKAELNERFDTKKEAEDFLNICLKSSYVVDKIEKKPSKRSPSAPFTTSTLQQEASRKLGYSVAQTMVLAQRLYESGKITYMRTDSVNLSDTALTASKEAIETMFGAEYSESRNFKTKSKGAQEAHEAIRPTIMGVKSVDGESKEQKLYELIWKRTIASQMSDAKLEKTNVHIKVSGSDIQFKAQGEIIVFDGFLKVYSESSDEEVDNEKSEEEKGLLPVIKEKDSLQYMDITATMRFSNPPARYSEASLVRKLEENGIGRPSTYAPTISTIQKRGYVVKESREGEKRSYQQLSIVQKDTKIKEKTLEEIKGAEKMKLFPTDVGIVVNDFLVEHFERIMDYGFTASVEKDFDEIAEGNLVWNDMIGSFYKPFHKNVEDTLENSEKATGERLLGEDPKTGKPVYAKIGRFGPMIQIGDKEDEEKPKFASIRGNQSIQNIDLEAALKLFDLPKVIGEFEGAEMVIGVGRFGPYIRHDGKFYSIKEDPMSIEAAQAIEIIKEKREIEKKKMISDFGDENNTQVLNGRYGPYIKSGKKNYKIPKGTDPDTLTLEVCLDIISKSKK